MFFSLLNATTRPQSAVSASAFKSDALTFKQSRCLIFCVLLRNATNQVKGVYPILQPSKSLVEKKVQTKENTNCSPKFPMGNVNYEMGMKACDEGKRKEK